MFMPVQQVWAYRGYGYGPHGHTAVTGTGVLGHTLECNQPHLNLYSYFRKHTHHTCTHTHVCTPHSHGGTHAVHTCTQTHSINKIQLAYLISNSLSCAHGSPQVGCCIFLGDQLLSPPPTVLPRHWHCGTTCKHAFFLHFQ